MCTRGTPSGSGDPCRRRGRDDLVEDRVGVCAIGAEEVKYESESVSDSTEPLCMRV